MNLSYNEKKNVVDICINACSICSQYGFDRYGLWPIWTFLWLIWSYVWRWSWLIWFVADMDVIFLVQATEASSK